MRFDAAPELTNLARFTLIFAPLAVAGQITGDMRAVPYACNYVSEPRGGYKGPVGVRFLPNDSAMKL